MAVIIDQSTQIPRKLGSTLPEADQLVKLLRGKLTLNDVLDGSTRYAYLRKPSPLQLSTLDTGTLDGFAPGGTYGLLSADALSGSSLNMGVATGGPDGAPIINNTTNPANLSDTAGLGVTATWGEVSSTPTTLASFGITDGQSDLGPSSGTAQILYRDASSDPYWGDHYGAEFNGGNYSLSDTNVSSTTRIQWGETIVLPDPGTSALFVHFNGTAEYVSANSSVTPRIEYSIDSGSSWLNPGSTGNQAYVTSNVSSISVTCSMFVPVFTPSNDIWVRVTIRTVTGTNTITCANGILTAFSVPNSSYSVMTGALSATVPSTASSSCSAVYPTTTCTASTTVKVSPSGGSPGYTYSWAKVSGTGTLSNTTKQTVTITDTETTSDAGASHNTVVNCTVTDSATPTPANVTTSNCTATLTFTRTYSSINVPTPSTTYTWCSTSTTGKVCTSTGTATANPSGGDGSYTYLWTKISGGATLTNTTSKTCNVSESGLTDWSDTNTLKVVVTDGHSNTGNNTCDITLQGNG